jgi:pyruvate dehydrogenase (quinone)
MASRTASDILVATLCAWGVDTVFAIPAGVNGIIEALRTHKDQIRFVRVRHVVASCSWTRAFTTAA